MDERAAKISREIGSIDSIDWVMNVVATDNDPSTIAHISIFQSIHDEYTFLLRVSHAPTHVIKRERKQTNVISPVRWRIK